MTAMDTESLVRTAAGHAAAVLELCADRYSGRGTPMLADHVDLSTGEPERWEGRVLSNLARQQHFLRVLAGLDALGESRFGDAARTWIEHALPAVADEGGLLYWGGHSTYALDEDGAPAGEPRAEVRLPLLRLPLPGRRGAHAALGRGLLAAPRLGLVDPALQPPRRVRAVGPLAGLGGGGVPRRAVADHRAGQPSPSSTPAAT